MTRFPGGGERVGWGEEGLGVVVRVMAAPDSAAVVGCGQAGRQAAAATSRGQGWVG